MTLFMTLHLKVDIKLKIIAKLQQDKFDKITIYLKTFQFAFGNLF